MTQVDVESSLIITDGLKKLTPEILINDLSPDLLVKGGDYKPEEVVGRDFVQSYGGKVVILPFVPGYSTTNIITKRKGKDLTDGEGSS